MEGAHEIDGGEIKIYYAAGVHLYRTRFTIAHEFIHILQLWDMDFTSDMESLRDEKLREQIIERVAQMSAAYYLAPPPLVMKMYEQTQDISEIARKFQVSKQVIEICVKDNLKN